MYFSNINLLDCLHSVKATTLVLYGDRDKAVPYENVQKLQLGIKKSRLAITIGGGHIINWENKDEFNMIVLDFLK